MLSGLFALIFITSCPAIAIGLISPRLVLPWVKRPTRVKALQLYGTMLCSSLALFTFTLSAESRANSAPRSQVPATNPAIAQRPVSALPTVLSVEDGDTIKVLENGQRVTIRLACIDAPEGDQPSGAGATMRLRSYLPVGQTVKLRPVTTDRYGRTVAELYLANQSLNLKLVEEGWAVVYRQYLSACAKTQAQYISAEQQAKTQQLGFWSVANPIMPWEWRQGNRVTRPEAVARPTARPAVPSVPTVTTPGQTTPTQRNTNGLPSCVNADCDCKDFTSQAQAQQVLNAFPGDPFKLDRDRDGIACESLR
jgi:micrococcal nuclease